MPFVYVPESVGSNLESTWPRQLSQSASSRVTPTVKRSSLPDSLEPPFGTTSKPGSPATGKGSTSSAQASPASPGVLPGSEESRRTNAGSGPESRNAFAWLDPASSSWKTSQGSLLEDSDTFSRTWPRWGLMRRGECFPAAAWVPHTSEIESSFWQTPIASEDEGTGFRSRGTPKLAGQAKGWPTPKACNSDKGGNPRPQDRGDLVAASRGWPTPTASKGEGCYENGTLKLSGEAALWPTPCAQENDRKNSTGPWMQLSRKIKGWPTPTAEAYGNNQSPSPNAAVRPGLDQLAKTWPTPLALDAEKTYDNRGSLGTIAHGHLAQMDPGKVSPGNYGQLSPRFVEWLMGFPDLWTAPDAPVCEHWATLFRPLLRQWLGFSWGGC